MASSSPSTFRKKPDYNIKTQKVIVDSIKSFKCESKRFTEWRPR